jgi:hypothetical protein
MGMGTVSCSGSFHTGTLHAVAVPGFSGWVFHVANMICNLKHTMNIKVQTVNNMPKYIYKTTPCQNNFKTLLNQGWIT